MQSPVPRRERDTSLVGVMRESASTTDERMRQRGGRSEEQQLMRKGKGWKAYRTLCQFRFGYFSFLWLMVILIFSFTLLMEIFFAVFLPSARLDPNFTLRAVILLAFLPVVLLFLSYAFEEASRFFFDCINKRDGSIANFRLACAVLLHYFRHASEMPEEEIIPEEFANRTTVEKPPLAADENTTATTQISRWKVLKATHKATRTMARNDYEGPSIDHSSYVFIDFLCPFLFEVVTLAAFVIEFFVKLSPREAFYAYIRVGFYCVGVYLVLWIIVHFWSMRNGKMRALLSNYRRTRRAMKDSMKEVTSDKKTEYLSLGMIGFRFSRFITHCCDTGGWCSKCNCCSKRKDEREEFHNDDEEEQKDDGEGTISELKLQIKEFDVEKSCCCCLNIWNNWSFTVRFAILIPFVIGSAVLSFYIFYLGWIAMGITLIVLGYTIQRRFPQIFGTTFKTFIVAFVFLSLIFFSSSWAIGTFVIGGGFKVYPPNNHSLSHPAKNITWGNLPQYPICTLDYNTLNIMDFVLIADAAYGSTPAIKKTSLYERFHNTSLSNFKYIDRTNADTDPTNWMEIHFPSPEVNMTVIAIRGTASATDALEDLHFWFGISIMQFANLFLPFLSQLPRSFVVKMLSMKLLQAIMPEPVYSKLLRHVQKIRKTTDRLVLVGHSLGGATAAMLGAKTKTPALSFSGPGLIYSRGRFNIEEKNIRDYVVTVKPMNDIVPRVDLLGGMVQEIQCRKTNPLACHSTTTHACELYYSCGDSRHRDWSRAKECKNFIK